MLGNHLECAYDPDDPEETGKPEEVIRGSGDGSPPARSSCPRGRAPGGGWGKAPETPRLSLIQNVHGSEVYVFAWA